MERPIELPADGLIFNFDLLTEIVTPTSTSSIVKRRQGMLRARRDWPRAKGKSLRELWVLDQARNPPKPSPRLLRHPARPPEFRSRPAPLPPGCRSTAPRCVAPGRATAHRSEAASDVTSTRVQWRTSAVRRRTA